MSIVSAILNLRTTPCYAIGRFGDIDAILDQLPAPAVNYSGDLASIPNYFINAVTLRSLLPRRGSQLWLYPPRRHLWWRVAARAGDTATVACMVDSIDRKLISIPTTDREIRMCMVHQKRRQLENFDEEFNTSELNYLTMVAFDVARMTTQESLQQSVNIVSRIMTVVTAAMPAYFNESGWFEVRGDDWHLCKYVRELFISYGLQSPIANQLRDELTK
jgi:hypothetical protein